MTEKQIQRILAQIDNIKKALAAEKRKFGGYMDSRGVRYLPPSLYLRLQDYKGAARYFQWFEKNFPDDIGWPDFLFEWTITLFKNQKLKEAEIKAYQTYFSNTYLLDQFLYDQIIPIDKEELASYQQAEIAKTLPYSKNQEELADFSHWLENLIQSQRFIKISGQYIAIQKQLKSERPGPKRNSLLKQARSLLDRS